MGDGSMMLTVAQVLEHYKVPKTTLYRKMDDGSISFQKQGTKRLLDPAEIERAFPQWNKREVPPEQNGTGDGNSDLVESLRDQIRHLERSKEDQIRILERSNEDLKTRLDRAEDERSQVLRLLTDQRVDDPPKKKKSTKGKKTKKGKGKKKK